MGKKKEEKRSRKEAKENKEEARKRGERRRKKDEVNQSSVSKYTGIEIRGDFFCYDSEPRNIN